ncbi:MAG: sigma-70 family RNA polymerase sigma factor [Polyangiaceae bacterium]
MTERSKKEIDVLVRSVTPMLERYARSFAAEWPRFQSGDFLSIAFEAALDAAARFDPAKGVFPVFVRLRVLGAFYDFIRKEFRETPLEIQAVRMASLEVPKAKAPPFDASPAEARAHLVREQRLRVQRMAILSVATQTEVNPESLILEKDETARAVGAMNAALKDLKDAERKALIRTRVDGRTLQETADELGVSTKSVQRYIERAATRLRDALVEAGIESHESAIDAATLFVQEHKAPPPTPLKE